MNYQHPRDLPPDLYAEWEERAAIIAEGNRLEGVDGHREANRRAFAEVVGRVHSSTRSVKSSGSR